MSKFLYLKYQDWKVIEGDEVGVDGVTEAAVATVTVEGKEVKLWVVKVDGTYEGLAYDDILEELNKEFKSALGVRNFVIGVRS